MKTLRKVPFHLQPFAVMTYPSAPGANFEQPFQVMQTIHQFHGKAENNGPNIYNHEGLSGGIAPISLMNFPAEKELRQSFKFIHPGKRDYQKKTDSLIP
jgi:hypothetical protein